MRLALAQIASSEDRAQNLSRVLDSMDEAAAAGAEVVAFPEVVLDRFFPAEPGTDACRSDAHRLAEPIPGPTVEKLQAKAKAHGLVTVFNLYERVDRGDRRLFFDSSPVIDADGRLLGTTRMVHITDYEGFHEQDYYDPGDTGAPVYDTAAGRIGVAICYDRH
ncbi:MAG: nitrilase-related carbon-nitrogen hydrolase, partial [Acidobacteriota bacterium]